MKLIKFKTELTYSQLVTEFEKIPMTDLEFIINLSNYFDYIDVNFENNKTGLFGIMADCYRERIESFFKKYSIPYKSSDISKDIFFDNVVEFSTQDDDGNDISNKITIFLNNFKNNYITQDDVLDKILEKGMESLTDFDKNILK